ncbi:hypothetical protein CRYUN_Cryun03dG0072500 [Craigia yunnanensis]
MDKNNKVQLKWILLPSPNQNRRKVEAIDLSVHNIGFHQCGDNFTCAFVAGARDLSFDAYSYSIVFIANICTTIYLASIAHIGKSSGLNSFGLMWCNGIICAPILLFWMSFKSVLEAMMSFPYLYSRGFQKESAFIVSYFANASINTP